MTERTRWPRRWAWLIAVAAIGVGGGWLLAGGNIDLAASGARPASQFAANAGRTGTLSVQAASEQRASHYRDLETIAAIRELPSAFARREALYVVAGRADERQVRTLIDQAKNIPDESERLDTLGVLLQRYVELDSPAALRSAMQMDRATMSQLVPAVIGAWSKFDLPAAVAAAKELPATALRETAAHEILANHVANGPDGLRKLAATLGVADVSDEILFKAHAGRVLEDPHQSITIALRLPDARSRNDQLLRIAAAWTRIAPEEAWDYAAQLTDPSARSLFQNAVIETWTEAHPADALGRIAALAEGRQREHWLQRAAAALAKRDPQLALEQIAAIKTENPGLLRALVVREWALGDVVAASQWIEAQDPAKLGPMAFEIAEPYVTRYPEEALAWALRISRSPARNLWTRMVGIMAEQDPQEALRIAQAAERPAQRAQALTEVITAIGVADPAAARDYIDKYLSGSARKMAVYEIGRQLTQKNPDAALDWFVGLDDPRARFEGLNDLVGEMTVRDLDAAVRMLERVPKESRANWIGTVASRYAGADPEKGIRWVKRFQDEPGYGEILHQFAGSLAYQSPQSALDLVEDVADGRQRDQLLSQLLSSISSSSPEIAIRSLDRISDEQAREQAMAGIANTWADNDFPATRKWVLSLAATPSRDRLVTSLASNGSASTDDSLALLGEIRSQEQLMGAVMNVALRLSRSDPDAMRTLLRRYPLDPARQQQLDSYLKRRNDGGW